MPKLFALVLHLVLLLSPLFFTSAAPAPKPLLQWDIRVRIYSNFKAKESVIQAHKGRYALISYRGKRYPDRYHWSFYPRYGREK